jgi:gamma-glutamylaminecyclotransferase
MCVIIIKQQGLKVSAETLKTSARINPHGLGIIWLDTYEVEYHKSTDYNKLNTDRPYIAHFRYATVGVIGRANTHPFVCGKRENELLMMNGTIKGLGNTKMCDSKVLANSLGEIPRHLWDKELSQYDCRFITANTHSKSFQIYNREAWHQKNGVWYSKDNVLEDNYVAVYGTLKQGYSNYWNYLSASKFIGKGKTEDKYPLIVSGLPYLIEEKGVGHNVIVDVFKVTDSVLKRLDILEGHPNWYRRKQINIVRKDKVILCWIYFNINETSQGKHHHSTFIQKPLAWTYKESKYSTSSYLSGTSSYQKKYTKPQPTSPIPTLFKDWFAEEVDDTPEFDISKEAPLCLYCYQDLVFDGFNNYHCSSCNNWFTQSDVEKNNY